MATDSSQLGSRQLPNDLVTSTNKSVEDEKVDSGSLRMPIFSVGRSCTVVCVLPRVPEMCISFGEDSPSNVIPFTLVRLNDILKGNLEKAQRIYNIALHTEGHNMHNLFSVNPRKYDISSETHRVVNGNSKEEATFFTVGIVTSSSLTDGLWNREINVQPMGRLWPRQHAVLMQLLHMNDLVMPTYKKGIQYSTSRKPKSAVRPWNVDDDNTLMDIPDESDAYMVQPNPEVAVPDGPSY
ncbi:hypothetical protein EDD18DRAFT_1107752 [Armillaria luteobubalina]|uniref:Uncharacterized protein n=1 Tax=Armillaria luteobubalina TaxID=153913 RepID=A0AA39Q0Y8_9AGAR|nr:hypothetical protein EDD18DRAFT_1107752 [Armillaria luteobubalina]